MEGDGLGPTSWRAEVKRANSMQPSIRRAARLVNSLSVEEEDGRASSRDGDDQIMRVLAAVMWRKKDVRGRASEQRKGRRRKTESWAFPIGGALSGA